MRRITFTKEASRALEGMPADQSRLVLAKIRQLAEQPGSLVNNVKRLRGVEGCRLRVGDWRVIYSDDGRVLAILKIGARGSIYD